MESALAAAEAYAQEQADQAARERDLAEMRQEAAANYGLDMLVPPEPTAADRALAAFW
jgi:hypothetical protein